MSITPDLMYRLLVQGVSDYAIYMIDHDGIVLNWNAGAERAKGYAAEDIVGRNYEIFYSLEDRSAGVPRRNLETARREGRVGLEGWRYRSDGSAFWASITIDAIHDATGAFLGFAKITRDLTEQHELMARIEHQANHDSLTGLLNRAGLFKGMMAELARGRPAAVHCIDLDHFKPINDRLGHAAGDAVLREVARRLTDTVRGSGFAGRIGGDEFVAVQCRIDGPSDARGMGDAIVSCLRMPMKIEGEPIAVGASVGVAQSPLHGTDIGTLLRNADVALYRAKENGRNRIAVFTEA